MIVFFTGVFAALETVLSAAVFHAAPCDFAGLVPLTAAATGTVFIQEHREKPTIQTAEGK